MWKGEVVWTQLAIEAAAPMEGMDEVVAVAGRGVEGDRYFKEIGFFSHNKGVRRQLTLFEVEVLEAIKRDQNTDISPSDCRMNLGTRNVPLSHLVGREFRVGEAILRGVELNEPCQHLEDVVGKRLIPYLIHRSGLFAEILRGGIIRPGDTVSS